MINVYYQTEHPDIDESWTKKIVGIVLEQEKSQQEGILSIVFLDNAEMTELNRKFFSKDRSTDVIAFPLEDDEDDIWGEVYINVEKAEEQAVSYAVSPAEELARLVVHGVLHLHGFVDLDQSGRDEMTAKEDQYLENFRSKGIL